MNIQVLTIHKEPPIFVSSSFLSILVALFVFSFERELPSQFNGISVGIRTEEEFVAETEDEVVFTVGVKGMRAPDVSVIRIGSFDGDSTTGSGEVALLATF
jgi:hypothetical protein